MRRLVNSILIVVFVFSLIPPSIFLAQVEPLPAGIQEFGYLLNQLWNFEEFNQQIPLSDTTPSKVLQLNQLFSFAFTQATGMSNIFPYGDDIQITINTIQNSNSTTITLEAVKTEDLPLQYLNQPEEHTNFTPTETGTCEDFDDNDGDGLLDSDDPDCAYITIIGGKVPTTFTLHTELTFIEEQIDGNNVFYLKDDNPIISISYSADAENMFFESVYNIADIEVAGSAQYNVQIDAKIIDENNDGKITAQDWKNTILVDLIQMNYVESQGVDDVYIELSLSLDEDVFNTGNGEGSLLLDIPELSDPNMSAEVTLADDQLAGFRSIDSDALLTGLGSYAVALDSMWIAGEGELPFLLEQFHNLSADEDDQFLPGDTLRDFLKRQSDALVYCLTEELTLLEGETNPKYDAYCQAFTPSEPKEDTDEYQPKWVLGDLTPEFKDNQGNSTTLGETIGISPEGWAIFSGIEKDEWKDIELTYFYEAATEEELPEEHVVEPRIRSIGDLKSKLEGLLPGLDEAILVNYDKNASTLVFDIYQEYNTLSGDIHFAFGNQLQKYTGISDLHPSQSSSPSMSIESVKINAGFGSILVDNLARISPDPKWEPLVEGDGEGIVVLDAQPDYCTDGEDNDGDGWVDMYDLDCPKLEDRFFLQADPLGPEIEVSGLSINGISGYQMEGRVGSVAIEVTVNGFNYNDDATLQLDLVESVIEVEDSVSIPGATGVRDIIYNPANEFNRFENLAATGSLSANANMLDLNETVYINTTVEPNNILQSLGIAPSIIGEHDDTEESPIELHDGEMNFIELMGVNQGDFVSKTIYNLTNGSTCTGFTVEDENTLICNSPLAGNDESEEYKWNLGDKYIIQGDPRALLTLIEDSLYRLAGELTGPAGKFIDPGTGENLNEIPVIGMNMRDLVPQLREVRNKITQIRNGDPYSKIFCEIVEEVGQDNETHPVISCYAESEFDPTSVNWDITNRVTRQNFDDTSTINPTAEDNRVKFTVEGLNSPEDLEAFSVTLELYHDGLVEPDVITYPYQQPQTLQEFNQAFEETADGSIGFKLKNGSLEVTLTDNRYFDQLFLFRTELVNIETGDLYLLAELDAAPEEMLDAQIQSNLTLGLEIPLYDKHVSLQDVKVLESTQVTETISLAHSDFEINASLGGSEVVLGPNADLPSGSSIELDVALKVADREGAALFYDSLDETVEATFTILNQGNNAPPFIIYDSAGNQICTIDAPAVPCSKSDYTISTLPDFVFAEKSYAGFSIQSAPQAIYVPPRLDLAVTADPLIYENGTDITITYKITNNGDIQLQNVSLLDGDDNPVCPDQNPLAALDPGVTEFCEAQLNSEGLLGINVHAVSETPVTSSPSVQFFSGEEQDTPQTGLLVEKYAGYPLKYSETDTTVEIPFLLTNTGNVAIKGPFNFEEDLEDTDPNPVFECIVLNETADDLAVLPPDQSKICILEVQAPEYLASAKLEKTFQVIFNNGANTSPDPVSIEAHNNSYQAISMSLTKKLEITSEKTLGEFSEAANDFTISSSDEAFNFVFNLHASDGSSNVRIGPADSYPIQIDSDIADGLALAPMELSLVTLGFDMLGSLLEQNLDADRWEYKRIPFAGSDLAVGIDFSEVTNALGKPLIDFFEQFASETSTLSDLCAFEFDDTTDDTGDLIKISDKFVITALDSDENEATCSNTNDPPLDQIAEFSLQLQAEYDIETKIPFDIGLPGLPLESTDNAPVEVGGEYTLNPIIGIDRSGPYIGSVNSSAILTLEPVLSMKQDNVCSVISDDFPSDDEITHSFDAYIDSDYPCMQGVIGLLQGTIYNIGAENLAFQIDVGENARIGYADYLYGSEFEEPSLTKGIDINGQIDLLFKTTAPVVPVIVGEIHLTYDPEAEPADRFSDLGYSNIFMNVDYTDFIGSAVQEVQKYTKPLQPVVDTLTSPLPVVSDLATMVGQNPISLMSIMQAVPSNKLTMIIRLTELISFINSIPASTTGIWLGLGEEESEETDEPGWFDLDIETVINKECAQAIEDTGDFEPKACDPNEKYKKLVQEAKANKNKKFKQKIKSETSAEASWEGAGISMPILTDTSQVYGLLLGIDATLIRVDLGTLKASAGLEFTYGPFLVGPVPVSISMGGTITLEGRFAMGFDTLGLRSTLRGDSFSENDFAAGIFIDDLDSNGNDVPEIRLGVEIYAGAAVSIRIIEAGIRAGVTFDVYLNWNDPNHDGKLRFSEIGIWASKPICLFDRRGAIGFYLEFYLKFDFWLFSTTVSWRPINKSFDVFNESCDPPEPNLASVKDNRLVLHMGNQTMRNDRGVYTTEINEKFIVRQLTPRGEGCYDVNILDGGGPSNDCKEFTGTWVSVTFQGIHQLFFLEGDNYIIFAEAYDGNDQISLLPGTRVIVEEDGSKTTEEVLFTIGAELYGGEGNDRIDTGNGDDYIEGNGGDDNLSSRGGVDTIKGGDGIDSLDGGLDNDDLYGEDDDDIINGGPGTDYIFGQAGNDSLFGGPGLSSEFTEKPDLQDGTDYISGGAGMDTLEGGFGNDCLFGDDVDGELPVACTSILDKLPDPVYEVENANSDENQETDESYDDHLIGGDDNDYLYGSLGNDTLEGGKGTDELYGQEDHDYLMGGRDDDWLYGGDGHDWLQGDQGNDHLYGGLEDDDLIGGDGKDELFGEGGNDILLGDLGTIDEHDLEDGTPIPHRTNNNPDALMLVGTIYGDHDGSESTNTLIDLDIDFLITFGVGPGTFINKTIYNMTDGSTCPSFTVIDETTIQCTGVLNSDKLDTDNTWQPEDQYAIQGDTLAIVQAMTDTTGNLNIPSDEYNDILVGGTDEDFIFGEAGSDTMYGLGGNDYLEGNAGADRMDGNDGQDIMLGGPGNDIIYGGGGWNYPNTIEKDRSEDLHDQGDLSDTIRGNSGNDIIYGNLGDDQINGNTGNDYIEGNAGEDTIHGGPGDDDIIGGSNEATQEDSGDTLFGDEGSDTILGDNGAIEYFFIPDSEDFEILEYELEDATENSADPLHRSSGISSSRINREAVMLDVSEFSDGETEDEIVNYAGPDTIYGGPGDDQIFGQWEGYQPESAKELTVADQMDQRDNLYGEQGQDLIIGDQGTVVCEVNNGNQAELRTKAPFLIDEIYVENTLQCTVTLEYDGEDPKPQDGDDLISGGENTDWLFGGGGIDLINGDEGNDRIFGGFGDDFLWGGPDHDHLWGGSGKDHLDVLPREASEVKVKGKLEPIDADPEIVFEWADADDYTGIDYMYGGLGQDAMQADVAPKGPNLGDRMIDWIGVYNIYYLCTAQYGEGVITRSPSPQVIDFLVRLAASDGADRTYGSLEVAIVYQQYFKSNSHPPHSETPGHFTCEP